MMKKRDRLNLFSVHDCVVSVMIREFFAITLHHAYCIRRHFIPVIDLIFISVSLLVSVFLVPVFHVLENVDVCLLCNRLNVYNKHQVTYYTTGYSTTIRFPIHMYIDPSIVTMKLRTNQASAYK